MPPPIRFLPPPYTYLDNIDVRERGWTVPNNVVICEIRVVARSATQEFDLCVGTDDQSGDKIMRGRGENIWRVMITHIRMFKTTPIIRDRIEVYGYYADQTYQFMG